MAEYRERGFEHEKVASDAYRWRPPGPRGVAGPRLTGPPVNYETIERAIHDDEAARAVPALCLPTLTKIADGKVPLRAVRHPLGFLCLPVQRKGMLGVCVHVWTTGLPQAVTTTSVVHAHSWDLASFVLYGTVGNVLMHVVDDAQEGTHRVFQVHSLGDVDEMRATRRLVRCVEQHREVVGVGSAYYLRAGDFHESVVEANPEVATVVLGRVGTASDLSLGPPDILTHRIARQRCGARETADAAQIVIERLVNSSSILDR